MAGLPIDGAAQRLGEVVKLVDGHPPLIGDALVNGAPGLLLVVEKFPGVNTLAVTQGVDAALRAMQPGLPGIELSSVFRAATFIETAFANLTSVLLVGSALVVLVLGAFLYNWRSGVISGVAIPLSLVAAAFVLYLRGATFNAMVLAGFVVALGAIVADAIIDIENVMRRLRQQRQEGSDTSTARLMLETALQVRSTLDYALLIEVLAVVPIFFLGDVSGAFFQPLAISYALAILVSMVVALTVTPALGLILLPKAPLARRESPLVQGLQRVAEAVLARTVRTPGLAYGALGVLVVVGLVVGPRLNQALLPSFQERHLRIEMEARPGMSHPAMARMASQVSNELRSIRGVRAVGAHVGRAETGDQVVGMNAGQIWLTLEATADYDQTVAKIQETVHGYPGLAGRVDTYLTERTREALTGEHDGIIVRVFGPDRDTLRRLATEVEQTLAKVSGIAEVQVERPTEEPQVQIKVDLAKAERYGLKPGDVRRQAATVFAGLGVGNLYDSQKVFDVVVWGAPETRQSLTSIHEFLLETPTGDRVRLGEVAEVRIVPTPTSIRHDAIARRLDVVAHVPNGGDHGAVVSAITRRLQDIKFPLEYHAELKGEYVERQAAQQRVFDVAIAAALGIFLLLQAAFRSWRLAVVAFVTLPIALVGGLLAAFVGGNLLSLGALIGFLALVGVAARSGILLITHYQHLQQRGETFGPGLVLRGTRDQFAPIVMTAAALGAALVPLVLFGTRAGLEIVHPLAVVMLGGLVTSTLLTLFVVPALYLRFGCNPEPDTANLS
jgi:Cu/Ag efflux pump CusA